MRSSLLSPLLSLKLSRSLFLGRLLNCGAHDHKRSIRTRDRAANENYFFGLAHLHHLQILYRHPLITQMSGHTHVFPDPARGRTIANGTIPPMGLRSMGCSLTRHVMLFHHSLKSFAFGTADDIDKITRLKLRDT